MGICWLDHFIPPGCSLYSMRVYSGLLHGACVLRMFNKLFVGLYEILVHEKNPPNLFVHILYNSVTKNENRNHFSESHYSFSSVALTNY